MLLVLRKSARVNCCWSPGYDNALLHFVPYFINFPHNWTVRLLMDFTGGRGVSGPIAQRVNSFTRPRACTSTFKWPWLWPCIWAPSDLQIGVLFLCPMSLCDSYILVRIAERGETLYRLLKLNMWVTKPALPSTEHRRHCRTRMTGISLRWIWRWIFTWWSIYRHVYWTLFRFLN